jgi:hypothetical protein
MPDWMFRIIIVTSLLTLIAAIWRAHEKRDEERFTDVWNQIGRDGNSGMRKNVHDVPGIALTVDDLRERVARLEDER